MEIMTQGGFSLETSTAVYSTTAKFTLSVTWCLSLECFSVLLIPSSFLFSNTGSTKGPCDCLLINLAEHIHIGSLNAYQC